MQEAAAESRRARDRDTTLLRASSLGDASAVEALLGQGASASTACDQRRSTPLHLAAARGHANVVETLLSHGCDVDVEDDAGRTALHVASLCVCAEVAQVLIQRGAWLEATDSSDATPLCYAAAAYKGGVVVRALLAAGASHAVRDNRGLTPLAHAVVNDEGEATQALLAAGADGRITVPDSRGQRWSLLHIASAVGALHSARLLLSAGCCSHTDADNALRITPLHAAAGGAHVAVTKLLLGWQTGGAVDVNALSSDASTPLDTLLDAQLLDAAADDVRACEMALRAAGGVRGSREGASSRSQAQRDSAGADDNTTPTQRLARQFAAMPAARQLEQLDRWVAVFSTSTDAAGTDAAASVALSVPTARALQHIRAAAELRLHADLDDVIMRLLDDDEWQDLMRQPAVRSAVEAVQSDPKNVVRWQEHPDCMQALEQLRRLQHFCKPRGLKTSLTTLLRTADNTAESVRKQCASKRDAARNAIEAARADILNAASMAAEHLLAPPTPSVSEIQAVTETDAPPSSEEPVQDVGVSFKSRLWDEMRSALVQSLLSAAVALAVVTLVSRIMSVTQRAGRADTALSEEL